jgi:hypothetical protein
MATMAINDIVTTIGVDLGKNVFHIVGMNARGAIVLREPLSRAKLARRLRRTANRERDGGRDQQWRCFHRGP